MATGSAGRCVRRMRGGARRDRASARRPEQRGRRCVSTARGRVRASGCAVRIVRIWSRGRWVFLHFPTFPPCALSTLMKLIGLHPSVNARKPRRFERGRVGGRRARARCFHARHSTPAVAARAPGAPQASRHVERPGPVREPGAVAMSSSQQKRPAARKRPVPSRARRPAGARARRLFARQPPPPAPRPGGLLRSIIGGIKREGAAVKAAVADGRAVTKADVETRGGEADRGARR